MTVVLRASKLTNLMQQSFDEAYMGLRSLSSKPFSAVSSMDLPRSDFQLISSYLDCIADDILNMILMSFLPITDSGIGEATR